MARKLCGFESGQTEGSFLWMMRNMYSHAHSVIIFLVNRLTLVGVSHATAAPAAGRGPVGRPATSSLLSPC